MEASKERRSESSRSEGDTWEQGLIYCNLHSWLPLLQEGLPRLGVLGLACSDGGLRVMVYVHLITAG